jgi:hypothetical protein
VPLVDMRAATLLAALQVIHFNGMQRNARYSSMRITRQNGLRQGWFYQ